MCAKLCYYYYSDFFGRFSKEEAAKECRDSEIYCDGTGIPKFNDLKAKESKSQCFLSESTEETECYYFGTGTKRCRD